MLVKAPIMAVWAICLALVIPKFKRVQTLTDDLNRVTRENLTYCNEGASEEKMKKACSAVGLDHFICTLPKGYDTVLNNQVNLSQ